MHLAVKQIRESMKESLGIQRKQFFSRNTRQIYFYSSDEQ